MRFDGLCFTDREVHGVSTMVTTQTLADARALGALVRTRRRALGLRQADLAFGANVGVRFIVDLENGKESCQIGRTLRLLLALGIRVTASYTPASKTEDPDGMGGIEL